MSLIGTSPTSQDIRLESAKMCKADIRSPRLCDCEWDAGARVCVL